MLLSIDVGTRNLGICLLDDDKNIVQWEVSSIPKFHTDGFCQTVVKHLNDRTWIKDATTTLIEKQPPKNKAMKRMEAYLELYCIMSGCPTVICYNAVNKVPDCPGKSRKAYVQRKKVGIERAHKYINVTQQQDQKWIDMFNDSGKKDDLADSLLQGLSYDPTSVVKKKEPKNTKVTPRRPTENQTRTKYSKSNLLFLFKRDLNGDLEALKEKVRKKKRWMRDVQRYYHNLDEACQEFFPLIM
jgi:hypothetical protein